MKKLLLLLVTVTMTFILNSCAGNNREVMLQDIEGQGFNDGFEISEIEPDYMFDEEAQAEEANEEENLYLEQEELQETK